MTRGAVRCSHPLRYHLRFQIIPGGNVEKDARTLAKFCLAHGVEEVVLFFAAEEWNNGLLSARDEDAWFDALSRIKPILDRAGIAASLNPWMTVLHCERGRRFPKGRPFKAMVSPSGEVSKACASFADPAWRAYICKLYGRFATLGFRVLWVEDDFRYHNHGPLTWGGGFEPAIVERFARKIGRKVTREALVKNILKPGKPHPWRALWTETWREIQLEVAADLSKAVAANAPGRSKLGLMSSLPATHSIEGRDWRRLFDALSIHGEVAHRPHFATYSEGPGTWLGYSIMMLDLQRNFRAAACEVAPEVENFPFTRWTKSDSLTSAQMAVALFYGSDALLLDLFPFCGNPADREPEIGELLDKSRPGLEWIASRFSKDLETCGVGLPWKEDAQARVRTAAGKRMEELDATSLAPGDFLLQYGIPVAARRRKVNAVFGSLAWAFDDGEWRDLLRGGVMLDGVSAEILCRRGFAAEIGLDFRKWLCREEHNYSLEQAAANAAGVPKGHYFSVNLMPRVGALDPRKGAQEWTTIITADRKRVGAGAIAFANKLGGRVFTFAAPNPALLPMNYHRQAMAQSAVSFLAKGSFESPMVTGGAHLLPIHFREGNRRVLVAFNGSPDPACPIIRMPRGRVGAIRATLLAPLAKPAAAKFDATLSGGSAVLRSRTGIPYLGYGVVEL